MEVLAAALIYAGRGWPVFPCSPDNKSPLLPKETAPGKKDGGLYLASTDEDQIRAWWKRWPKAMIGMPMGAPAGLLKQSPGAIVIDLDPELFAIGDMVAGLESWLGEPLPQGPVARTRSGGLHLWFQQPDAATTNRAGLFSKIADAPEAIRRKVDVRTTSGYVIMPPSVMAEGTFYSWEREPAGELPPLPAKLLDAILKKLDARPEAMFSFSSSNEGEKRDMPSREDAVARARNKYAMAALDREIGDLAAMAKGQRNDALNRAAYSLGGLVGAGILSATVTKASLMQACERNGLVAEDGAQKIWATIERAVNDGAAKPIDISQIGNRAGTSRGSPKGGGAAPLKPPPDSSSVPPAPSDDGQEGPASQTGNGPPEIATGGAGDELEFRCANLPLTDLGNAQRFLARSGADFMYVEQWGWLAWDGTRWNTHEAEAMVQRAVHQTVKLIAEEAHVLRAYALAINDDETLAVRVERFKNGETQHEFINRIVDIKKGGQIVTEADKLSGWCLASQSNAHLTCVAKLVQHYLTAAPERFDADPMAFNVANGTLRFAKVAEGDYVSFHPHRRSDLITKIAPVAFDAEAASPLYDAYLARVQPDEAMRRHLHAWGGLSLTALQVAKLSFWYGTGRNGKSVLADTWAFLLGDYVQTIPIESFLDQGRARRGGEASPDIASLPGVRMLRTSEPEKRSKLAESMIKLVTGGEPLRARHLNRDFFEFKPAFKLIMQGNYKPSIEGTDEGIWARMMLVPWTVMIPEAERDVNLTVKLQAEASGILNRLLDGIRDYLDNGLSPPDAVIAATAEYREDSDPIGRFLHDCTEPALKERTPGGGLYNLFLAWAKANGEHKWSAKAFKRGLADHGIRSLKSSTVFYLDIRATKTASDFAGDSFGGDDGNDGGGEKGF